jgi:hypothetical protein
LKQDPVTGEWRRCTKCCAKANCLAHQRSGKHQYDLARADDPGFPAHFDERRQRLGLQRGIDQIHEAVARFAARTNCPVREAGREALQDFVREIASLAVQLSRTSPAFQPDSIPIMSPTTLTRRIHEMGQEAFDRMIEDLCGRVCYVNLLTDSGTVLGFNTLHAVLTNPNFPDTIVPFDTYENIRFTAEQYEQFFCDMIQKVTSHGIEIVAIICDNCPAQINGVAQALIFHQNLGIRHIPCLNHMTNLVFTHILRESVVSQRMEILNDVITDLRSEKGIEILRRKCPTLVKTRWIYAVDVLRFILCRRANVEAVRFFFLHDAIPDSFQTLYWIFLPLKLFSRFMEARDRKLYEVFPLVREILCQFQTIRKRLTDGDDLKILDHVTAHFLARLKMNASEIMTTAWVLSHEGREWLRSAEQGFLTEFRYKCTLPVLECVQEMKTLFRAELDPWTHDLTEDEMSDPLTQSGTLEPISIPPGLIMDHREIELQAQTAVGRQRESFERFLADQYHMSTNERLGTRLDAGALPIAIHEIRSIAAALEMDADSIERQLRDWIFTLKIAGAPTLPDRHWRNVHAQGPEWHDLARLGMRYVSMGTSEAEVERLLGEQQDIQGRHGTNYGTESLHARLVLRHEHRN